MENIPNDPVMLLSFLNMKLRDHYSSLRELCDDLQLDEQLLVSRMASAGFEYDEPLNKFW